METKIEIQIHKTSLGTVFTQGIPSKADGKKLLMPWSAGTGAKSKEADRKELIR